MLQTVYTNPAKDWWLFIDDFVNSLKAVILPKTYLYRSLPSVFSSVVKENDHTLRKLL